MCYVVIAGGPNKDLSRILPRIIASEKIICADSGADALLPYNIVPDVVWGDMDSIHPDTRAFLENNKVSNRVFPVEKDMTDSELCLRSVPKDKKILFVTSLLGRLDHVMSNLLLTMRLKEEGYDIVTTDGNTWVFPLSGKTRFVVPDDLSRTENTCSMIPLGNGAISVDTFGMKYSLSDRDLLPGSSLTVSNEFDMTEKEHGLDMIDGTMLVIVTEKV